MTHSILEDDSTLASETVPSILNTLRNQVQNKQVDRDEQIDQLETEIRLLRRQIPKLKTYEGKDVATELILLGEAYDKKRYEVERLQVELEKCRKYFGETNKRHSNTVREYDQKLQSLRQEFEHSLIHESAGPGTGGGKTAMEQAQNIIATEYQSRIDALTLEIDGLRVYNQTAEEYEQRIATLNEELEALRAENKQYADERLDIAEQRDIDEEDQRRFDEMEAFYMDQIKKRDDIIAGLNNNGDSQDTVSQLHEKLENDRSRIRVNSNSSTSDDGVAATGRDVHEAFALVSNFKKMLQPLIFHLKKLPQFLEGVEGIPENEQFHELLRQITSISIDLDATVNDVTIALADLDQLERTLNQSPSPIFPPPIPVAEIVTTDALLKEVKSLRTKLQEEITLKRAAQDALDNAKAEIDDLTVRVEELVDEKISLQADLKDLEKDFNDLKKLYDQARESNDDVEKISKALRDARNSIESKTMALKQKTQELEQAKKQMVQAMKAYNELKDESDELNKVLDERTEEVNLLIDECERMQKELENGQPGSSQRYTAGRSVGEHQRLTKNIDALKKDNAHLLNQNKDLQAQFSESEKLLDSYQKYIKAVVNKLLKNDPTAIECPPFITERIHTYFIDRLDSSGPEVVGKFDRAYQKLLMIKNAEENDSNEHSLASNPPLAAMAMTLEELTAQLIKSRGYSNEIVQELKHVIGGKQKLDLDWLLQKNRQLRNVLHLSSKALEAKKEKIEDGAASLPDIIGELGKIHTVLDDANKAARVLRSDEVMAKGRSYRR